MDTTPAHKHPQPLGERLDSWKEIAAYLKRDIRTVQRWEKHEGLPVHRHLHDERGTAYAYRGEIDEWLQTRSRQQNEVPADGHSTVSGHAPDASSTSSGRSPRRLFLYVALAAALVAVIGTWALSRSSPAAVAPLSSLSIVFAPSERFHDWGPDFALSPDGSTLVYAGLGGRLHLRRIDQLSARGLEGTDGSWGPFFSPDGRWIGFNHGGHLTKVSVAAGTPVPLGVAVGFMGAADWGPDDNIVYAAVTPEGTSGLYRLPANGGGVPQLVAALDANSDETYWLTPQSVSNGKYILATLARSAASGSRFQIVAVSVATGARRILVDDARHAQYVGDGILVYWRNNALFATKLDADRIEVIGSHVPAWDDVFERVRLRSWASAAGVLVYWPNLRVSHRLVWVDRAGKQEPLPLPPAMYHAPRISPDGQRIAYSVGTEPDSDVWTYNLSTGVTARLTSGGRSASPLWTPDGTGLIISSRGAVGRDLAFLRMNGTAKPEPIRFPFTFLRGASKLPASWADGGRTLIVRQYDLEGQPPLWGFALDDGSNPRPIRPDSANHGRISPDGRWLAYNVSAYRRTDYRSAEVYVTDFPAAGPQWKVSTGGGVLPVWSRNGRELFYREGPRMMAVSVTPGETFAPGTARPLFEVPYYEADPGMPNYDVAPDGQRFVMVFPASTEGPDRLNVIQGWKTEILRRLGDSR
jgi:eukaryotic-like serine/threonine-protein kinase